MVADLEEGEGFLGRCVGETLDLGGGVILQRRVLAVEEPLPGCDVGGDVEVGVLGLVRWHLVCLYVVLFSQFAVIRGSYGIKSKVWIT